MTYALQKMPMEFTSYVDENQLTILFVQYELVSDILI